MLIAPLPLHPLVVTVKKKKNHSWTKPAHLSKYLAKSSPTDSADKMPPSTMPLPKRNVHSCAIEPCFAKYVPEPAA